MINIEDLKGFPLDEVKKILTEQGISFRFSEQDGQYFILTRDFKVNRINLYVKNGIVYRISKG